MRKLRHGPVQRFIQRNLFGRIGKMIIAPDYMRDLHQRVVDHDDIVVNRHSRRPEDDRIADDLVRKLDLSMDDVVEANRALRNMQASGACGPGSAALQGLGGIDGPAGSGIDWLAVFGLTLVIAGGVSAGLWPSLTTAPVSCSKILPG